jgi:DNA primase
METGGRIPTTPEQRAALQKRLKEYANQITDSTLRGHFSAQFNDRVWAGAKGRGKGGGRDGAQTADWTPSMELGADIGAGLTADMGGPPDSLRRAQQVLLAIIINHPEIFEGVEETLGQFSFGEGRLDQLRQELISVLVKNAELESDGVKDVLRQHGYAESLDVLFRDPLIRSNRILKADAPEEKFRPLWNENVALLQNLENAPEVEKIKEAGDTGIAEEDWERQKALLQETMPGHRD